MIIGIKRGETRIRTSPEKNISNKRFINDVFESVKDKGNLKREGR